MEKSVKQEIERIKSEMWEEINDDPISCEYSYTSELDDDYEEEVTILTPDGNEVGSFAEAPLYSVAEFAERDGDKTFCHYLTKISKKRWYWFGDDLFDLYSELKNRKTAC